jgi:lipid-A-disaccharide synthase
MGESQKLLMIVAGEVSGDMRAAEVASALHAANPSLRMTGVGGEHMKAAGVELFANITDLAVIGFVEVIKNYGRIKKVFHQVLAEVDRTKPDAVLLVDYPGFNLRLAKKLKERKVKVIYYVSPQVWAWKEKRVKTIKQVVDKMLVLFAFEQEFYKKHHMDVEYVGHPLIDEIKTSAKPSDVLKSLGFDPAKPVVGLLPGSREKEVSRHLPVMLKAAKLLHQKDPSRQFVVLQAPTITLPASLRALSATTLQRAKQSQTSADGIASSAAVSKAGLLAMTVSTDTYNTINATTACIVASGTATLETAILKKPMIVIYKTSWITYLLAKIFVKIKNIGLVNIVAGKAIVPELIQNNASPEKIAAEMEKLLSDPKEFHRIQKELSKIHNWLGDPGASRRAAKIIVKEIAN